MRFKIRTGEQILGRQHFQFLFDIGIQKKSNFSSSEKL